MDLKQLLGIPSLESLLGVGKDIVNTMGQGVRNSLSYNPEQALIQNGKLNRANADKLAQQVAVPLTMSPKIPVSALREMKDFTDYVAKSYRPDAKTARELEYGAAKIAETYGLKMPKTLKGLAHEFGRVLDKYNFK